MEKLQTQAKKQAKLQEIRDLQPSGASIWSYKIKKGTRWAFELRFAVNGSVVKYQKRGFTSKPICLAASQTFSARLDETKTLTVSSLLDKYSEHLEGRVSETTRANYMHLIRLYLPSSLYKQSPNRISSLSFNEHLMDLSKKGLKHGTVNTYRSRLNAMFNYGIRAGLVTFNPISNTDRAKPSLENALDGQPWTREEVLRALELSKGTTLGAFIHLAIFTGMRKGEILALKWADVDFSLGEVLISKSYSQRRFLVDGRVIAREKLGPVKTSASLRKIPISGLTKDFLKTMRGSGGFADRDFVISGVGGGAYSISKLGKDFSKFCTTNGIRRIRIHDLRHTSAVLSLLGRAPLEAVSQALGHSGLDVTKRFYAKRVSSFPQVFVTGIQQALGD